jgi:hypothetical protein
MVLVVFDQLPQAHVQAPEWRIVRRQYQRVRWQRIEEPLKRV